MWNGDRKKPKKDDEEEEDSSSFLGNVLVGAVAGLALGATVAAVSYAVSRSSREPEGNLIKKNLISKKLNLSKSSVLT